MQAAWWVLLQVARTCEAGRAGQGRGAGQLPSYFISEGGKRLLGLSPHVEKDGGRYLLRTPYPCFSFFSWGFLDLSSHLRVAGLLGGEAPNPDRPGGL